MCCSKVGTSMVTPLDCAEWTAAFAGTGHNVDCLGDSKAVEAC